MTRSQSHNLFDCIFDELRLILYLDVLADSNTKLYKYWVDFTFKN
jgi:hypothetical protein